MKARNNGHCVPRVRWAVASALAAMSTMVAGLSLGQSEGTVGGATDSSGVLHILDRRGGLRQLDGTAPPRRLERFGAGSGIVDVAVDGNGNLAVLMTVKRDERFSPQVGIYDWSGKKIREVQLPPRLQLHRIGLFHGRIVILATHMEEGHRLLFIDREYNLVPGKSPLLTWECEEPVLFSMAVDDSGIWVAPRTFCEGGYLARKYDDRGRVVTQIAKAVQRLPRIGSGHGQDSTIITPVLLDVFVAGPYLGVVLGGGTIMKISVDVWTTGGEFVKLVKVDAPIIERALGEPDGTVEFLEEDGGAVPANIHALLAGEPR